MRKKCKQKECKRKNVRKTTTKNDTRHNKLSSLEKKNRKEIRKGETR